MAVIAIASLCACSTELAGGDLGETPAAPASSAPAPPVVVGCNPFRSVAGVAAVTGAVRSLPQADGNVLLIVDDAVADGMDVASLAFVAPAPASLDDCLAGVHLRDASPTSALAPPTLAPLSGVTAEGASLLYYLDPRGSIGVATETMAGGPFRPSPSLLWTSDRPAYGSAAAMLDGDVYALGCRAARYLDADCFVARAALGAAGDESAYAYYVGGGRWSPRVDDAWPMTTGPSSVDLAWLAGEQRWLMAYVAPFARTIELRSGLSPEGPWSAPIPIATCDLADPDMFCAVHLHPALAAPPGTIALSYSATSLSTDAASRRAADPDRWAPRFVVLALPPLP